MNKLVVARFSLPVIAMLTLSSGVAAQTNSGFGSSLSCKPETRVYFANGVKTLLEDADEVATEFEEAYQKPLESLRDGQKEFKDEIYSFDVAYNKTVSSLKDVAEVMIQKAQEEGIDTEDLTGVELLEVIFLTDTARQNAILGLRPLLTPPGSPTRNYDPLEDPEVVAALRAEFEAYIADRLAQLDSTNTSIANQYISDLDSGKRVIVVPHSQGNLFANTTIQAAFDAGAEYQNSIGMFGVASAADRVIGGGNYITAIDDKVINVLRFIRNVLPGNFDNDPGFWSSGLFQVMNF